MIIPIPTGTWPTRSKHLKARRLEVKAYWAQGPRLIPLNQELGEMESGNSHATEAPRLVSIQVTIAQSIPLRSLWLFCPKVNCCYFHGAHKKTEHICEYLDFKRHNLHTLKFHLTNM